MAVSEPAVPLHAGDPHLSEDERAVALKWLDESGREFLASLNSISNAQWNWKPAPGRWSVGETEHIVLAEALLFASVQRAVASPANPDWEEQTRGKTDLLFRVIPTRQGRAAAPDRIVPREALTPAQVRERFENQRLDIVGFARETRIALKQHTLVHPFPIFGTLHAYQWVLYVPLHTKRHCLQIAEVRGASGYPAS